MTTRSYNQYCGLAYALDIVGERWTLLIIRELIAGPRRFTDLMDGLCDISTNLLTERLKSLEQNGLIRRRVLPPPAASTVYELTPLGMALEDALLELGKWGSQFMPPMDEKTALLHLGSYALTPMTFFRAEEARDVDETYTMHIDDELLQFHIRHGEIDVRQSERRVADVTLYAPMKVYIGLLAGAIQPEDALAAGMIQVEGNLDALRRFLRLCALPSTITGLDESEAEKMALAQAQPS
jgi:DNA-binding HxlR family transcriptional regulator